ncbi:esterase-like activity of phytase family protein [Spirillospora sp. CA-294931]|uniref:esterase-like activity of phytase family protein n=1 Tax=Spirillospora sp. CA-294931 TaxID=3240042 RepID=UPI003D8A4803
MRNWRKRMAVVTAFTTVIGSGLAVPAHAEPRGLRLTRLLGEQRLPLKLQFQGTTFGGVSGIDRDPRTGTWYLISDDRWRYNPARFYTGRLDIHPRTGSFSGIRLTGVKTLLRPNGTPYPGFGQPESADPETIRFDPRTRGLLWAHEGDRSDETHPGIPLSDVFVRRITPQGRHVGELPLPGNVRLTDEHKGPRRNFGFEGLTIAPHSIAAVIEGPRYEDGEQPTVHRGAPARITVWDRAGRRVRAQYAYQIDKLPAAPIPPTGATDTGVSEILAIDDHRYLALERSWLEGVNYKVKLYEFDLRGATNVLSRDSLKQGRYRPVRKRLIRDLSTITPTQNLEAMAWGPRLATGERTLVIASDDNFDSREITQFLAFGVRGR